MSHAINWSVMLKTDVDEPAFIALVEDCEGNMVGLHAPRATA